MTLPQTDNHKSDITNVKSETVILFLANLRLNKTCYDLIASLFIL